MYRMTKKLEFGGYKRNCENCPYYEECETEGMTCEDFMLMKLGELEDKIENGTLIEMPCRVGDEIYEIINSPNGSFIGREVVGDVWITEEGIVIRTGLYSTDTINVEEIGKTVFLTKAEAEAKLRELRDGKH